MAKYTVRLTGTSPVWADVEVEAQSAAAAKEQVVDNSEDNPAFTADWQLSEGGNGVNDWEFDCVINPHGDVVLGEGDDVVEDEEEEEELEEIPNVDPD